MAATNQEPKAVRVKTPNADFGVYFQITNATSNPIALTEFDSNNGECTQCNFNVGDSIPTDGKSHLVHLSDPCSSKGADGTVKFKGQSSGKMYNWSGACPVWSPTNTVSGPGITAYNSGGHPLTVSIYIDDTTPPSTLKK